MAIAHFPSRINKYWGTIVGIVSTLAASFTYSQTHDRFVSIHSIGVWILHLLRLYSDKIRPSTEA